MNDHLTPNQPVYSVDAFCKNNDISRAFLYLLWKRGEGPDYMDLGGRRKITPESETEWRRRMEAKSAKRAA
jgi:hypothetical protein